MHTDYDRYDREVATVGRCSPSALSARQARGVVVLTLCLFCAAIPQTVWAQTFTDLFNFNGPNGTEPEAAPAQGTDGNLYGVTQFGGTNDLGTLFKISSTGTLTTVYSFDGTFDSLRACPEPQRMGQAK